MQMLLGFGPASVKATAEQAVCSIPTLLLAKAALTASLTFSQPQPLPKSSWRAHCSYNRCGQQLDHNSLATL